MRFHIAMTAGFAMALGAFPANAEGLSAVEAINRCEAFVEGAIRPELGADFMQPYKMICYFGLIDPAISEDTSSVCARAAGQLVQPHRDIAEFMCVGAYQDHIAALE